MMKEKPIKLSKRLGEFINYCFILFRQKTRKCKGETSLHEKFYKVGGNTCIGTCSHESGMVPLPFESLFRASCYGKI